MTTNTLFCIASGPSLTEEDCEAIRLTRIDTVAVNNSWERARFCNFIYAGDSKWWSAYKNKININAELWTSSRFISINHKINYYHARGSFNSGMRAIQWGIWKGYKRIILLGYDCSIKNGIHWHKNHCDKNSSLGDPNDKKVAKWFPQFQTVADEAKEKNVEIINCSRYTELICFKTMQLEEVIQLIK